MLDSGAPSQQSQRQTDVELPLHVVCVGPGSLGLGLVGSVAGAAGLKMTLVARHGPDQEPDELKHALHSRGEYTVVSEGLSQKVSDFEVFWSDIPASRQKLLDSLSEMDADILLCTTLGSAQSVAAQLISDLLKVRSTTKKRGIVILCPCENTVEPSLSSLPRDYKSSPDALYADAMVDRFCKRPCVDSGGIVKVSVADEYEWAISIRENQYITEEDLSRVVASLSKLDVQIVNDIANTKQRKTLLCNGVHFCAALLARPHGHSNLAAYFATTEGRVTVETLTYEFALVLQSLQPDESEARIHSMQHWYYSRMVKNDHDIANVLRNLSSDMPAGFMRDATNKVGYPFEELRRCNMRVAKQSRMREALLIAGQIYLEML